MSLLETRRTTAQVDFENDVLQVRLTIPDADQAAFFHDQDPTIRGDIAVEAWRIGMRALTSAYARAEQGRLKEVGAELIGEVDRQLKVYLEQQEKAVGAVLQRYFSPEDGQVTQRLKAFIQDDGELARVLRQHVAPDRSLLAETLAQRVGETSPLFKMLSPTESEGLVQQMERRFVQALESHSEQVANALDPAAEGTPVHRFLANLKKDLREAGDDQEKMLKALTAAIDPANEESLINRLGRDVQQANKTLLVAINPDTEGSPMATIKSTLTKLVEKHMEENKELLEKSEERQKKFEGEVKESLARLEQRKREAERTTHGGLEFEEAVVAFVGSTVAAGPYIMEATGNTVGNINNSKVGDQIIRFSTEHAFAGCGLVVEAKRANNYSVPKALDELEEAKKNRGCDVGLFVMAASHRPKGFPGFARYGSSILVVWDEADPRTDAYLHAAVLTGLALATRSKSVGNAGDLAALHDVEGRVAAEIARLEKMAGFVGNIQRDAGKIDDEIRKGRQKLGVLITKANDVLAALKIQASAEDEERESPISVDDGSFERAVAAVRAVDEEDETAAPFEAAVADYRQRVSIDAAQIAAKRVRPDDETDE